MSNLRILCTADLHIGRSSALIGEISGVDCSAKGAWRRIVELAISEDADAVAIAGDLFDGRAGYLEGRRDFLDGCERLNSHAIPVVAVSGNHDHDVLPLFVASAPAGFHFLGNRGKWEFKSIETVQARRRSSGGHSPPNRSESPISNIWSAETARR